MFIISSNPTSCKNLCKAKLKKFKILQKSYKKTLKNLLNNNKTFKEKFQSFVKMGKY